MTRHVRAEALARYREGDLGGRRSARVRAHLAGCPRCSALDEDLARVSVMLASAPAPVMPEQVTARIEAALAAEGARQAPLGAGSARPAPLGAGRGLRRPGRSSRPGGSRHATGRVGGRRRHLPELLSPLTVRALAAAAAVVLAGGVYGAVQLLGGPSAAVPGSASSAAGIDQHGVASTGPRLAYASAGRRADFTPVSTGTDFQPGRLRSQVSSLLGSQGQGSGLPPANGHRQAATEPGALPSAPSASPLGSQSFQGIRFTALQGCVSRISAGRQVLLVDVDQYQGRPATVVVVAGGPGGSRVWVVGRGCSRTDSDVIAQASLAAAG